MTDPMPRKDVELPPRMPEAATIAELQRALLDARAERNALFRRATLAEEWRDHDKARAEKAEAELAAVTRKEKP